MAGADRCVCCGKIVPEGRQVCPNCQGTNGKRLIDANALVDKFWQEECRTQTRRDFVAMVNYAPTVDAVEVVHGSWIIKNNPITDPKKYFIRIVCSECNLHTGQKSNYCPQCGAKMDGGKENR